MTSGRRNAPFAAIALFALAFGVEEAIIVLYLRQLPSAGPGVSTAVAASVQYVYRLEIARECSTIVILAVVAWLAARRLGDAWRCFCFAFGIWDVVYYAALWVASGTPTLTSQDVLFLIPIPWIAPVWAAMSFATVLIVVGIFGVARSRAPLLGAGLALGLFSFVAGSIGAAVRGGVASLADLNAVGYPIWLYVPAIAMVAASLPWPRWREAGASVSQPLAEP